MLADNVLAGTIVTVTALVGVARPSPPPIERLSSALMGDCGEADQAQLRVHDPNIWRCIPATLGDRRVVFLISARDPETDYLTVLDLDLDTVAPRVVLPPVKEYCSDCSWWPFYAADLDGDGNDELVIVVPAWWVRVFAVRGESIMFAATRFEHTIGKDLDPNVEARQALRGPLTRLR
jgi:hypothetical protein